MRRNWMAIAAIADYWTRVAISLAKDLETIKRFQAGWPECFEEGEDAGPLRIPLSVLRAALRDYYLNAPDAPVDTLEFARCFWLTPAWKNRPELEIPIIAFGPDHDAGIPPGIAEQFMGQVPENLIKLTWAGVQYLVVSAEFATPPGERFNEMRRPNDLVELDKPFTTPPHLESLWLVLAELIDTTA